MLAFVCMCSTLTPTLCLTGYAKRFENWHLTSVEDDELGKFLFEGHTSRFSVLLFSRQKTPLFEITREL